MSASSRVTRPVTRDSGLVMSASSRVTRPVTRDSGLVMSASSRVTRPVTRDSGLVMSASSRVTRPVTRDSGLVRLSASLAVVGRGRSLFRTAGNFSSGNEEEIFFYLKAVGNQDLALVVNTRHQFPCQTSPDIGRRRINSRDPDQMSAVSRDLTTPATISTQTLWVKFPTNAVT
ncbi:hypothetical protein RRG08_045319 [Elysia crispata]|uniref:Uncharacterized protein n=1 Tax=Elysia crispata TaxID=231223 RepID=A0AAE1A1E8_9GAST|nr:hypothetical protein RRG08_045319 [Elysia crispata]